MLASLKKYKENFTWKREFSYNHYLAFCGMTDMEYRIIGLEGTLEVF